MAARKKENDNQPSPTTTTPPRKSSGNAGSRNSRQQAQRDDREQRRGRGRPKSATTTTTTAPPRPSSPTTTAPPVAPFDLESPGAVRAQLGYALSAKPDKKTGLYQIEGFGPATKQQRDSLVAMLQKSLSLLPGSSKLKDMLDPESPNAVGKQLNSALWAKIDPKTGMYDILGFGLATQQQRDELIKTLKGVPAGASSVSPTSTAVAPTIPPSSRPSSPVTTTTTAAPTTTTTAPSQAGTTTSTTVPVTPPTPATPTPSTSPGKTTSGKTTSGKTTSGKKTGSTTKPGAAPTVVVDGKKVKVGGEKWKTIIQEEFGSLWDVYNENADVKKVIDQSVAEGWYNDATKLTAALSNTNWFRTTQSSARQFAIRQSSDPATLESDINAKAETIRQSALAAGTALSDDSVRRLAADSIKFGYSETQLSNAIGSEVVATAKSGGPTAMAELSRGSTGTALREFAANYGVKPSDNLIESWTAQILSGQNSQQNYENMVKENARSLYKSLAPQIDKGMDVKTATAMYTNQAVNILGIDESQVDWSDAKWNKALNYQDPKSGEYRVMDASEWTRYLRSQPEWQNTDDAKNLYRSAAFTLAQAFGRTT